MSNLKPVCFQLGQGWVLTITYKSLCQTFYQSYVFSKKTTLSLVDQIVDDHDKDVLEMKAKAEAMWQSCPSKRERRTLASKEIPGYSFFGDNIGTAL